MVIVVVVGEATRVVRGAQMSLTRLCSAAAEIGQHIDCG